MNRLQKKCLIASVATHGLLLALLVIGPAFLSQSDETQTPKFITMIPPGTVDVAESSGGAPSQPPAAPPSAPPAIPPPAPTPYTPPAPAVSPPQPPPPSRVAPAPPVKVGDEEFKPVKPKITQPTTSDSRSDFTPVQGSPQKPLKKPLTPSSSQADREAVQQAAAQQARYAKMLARIGTLGSSLSKQGAEQVGSGPDTGEAVSNYRDIIYSMYYASWHPPVGINDNSATVTARITVSRDGRVTHHGIVSGSSNPGLDKSVENALDNVPVIAPFPDGSQDTERTYNIIFDPKQALE